MRSVCVSGAYRCGILLLTLILAGFVFRATAAWAAPSAPHDTVVTNCANDVQLRNAVNAAGNITFNCGTATIPISANMQVAGTVVIDGGGKITLDGGALHSFFQVFANHTLTLRNLSLTRGRFDGIHPLENFGSLTLQNVRMQNNTATDSGGVLTNFGLLTISGSNFVSNTGVSGAAVFNDGGTATIQNSTFTGNQLNGGIAGGAVAVNSGQVAIDQADFAHNHGNDGGAVFVQNGAAVTVTHSVFFSNTANYGGAIESFGHIKVSYTILDSNVAQAGDGGGIWLVNNAASLALDHATVSNNKAATTGGGLSCHGQTAVVDTSTFNGNQAGSQGGGIYSGCSLSVRNSTLDQNQASTGGGGGIYHGANVNGAVTMVTLTRNHAPFGAGIYNDDALSGKLYLQQILLAANSMNGGGADNCDGIGESLGYNFSSDSHCGGVLTQPTDQQNANLPLGALTTNGGPTQTRLPQTGNVAVDAIPANQCAIAFDQRDIVRPQHNLCDAGAVEVQPIKYIFLPSAVRK